MRRAASVIITTPATTASISATSATSASGLSEPVPMKLNVCHAAGQNRSTI
jgi:hypothetical protein